MRVVGIDTHKATLAACAIDEIGQILAEATFGNDPAGFAVLLAWLGEVGPIGRVGLEGSAGYGAAAARYLLAAGAAAVEVPPVLSHRERLRTRRPGKSDPGDALAIARVTQREAELPPVRLPDASRELQLIVEAREDLVAEATRVRNRLHADLVVLAPGYSARAANLVAEKYRRAAASCCDACWASRRSSPGTAWLGSIACPARSAPSSAGSRAWWPTTRCGSCGVPARLSPPS